MPTTSNPPANEDEEVQNSEEDPDLDEWDKMYGDEDDEDPIVKEARLISEEANRLMKEIKEFTLEFRPINY